MPTRMPVVNGIAQLARLLDHRERAARAACRARGGAACPARTGAGSRSRASSPRLTLTALAGAPCPSRVRMPALVCGRSPCASARSRGPVAGSRPCCSCPKRGERARGTRANAALGLVAEAEQRLDAALRRARARATAATSSWRHRPRAGIAGRAAERAVVAAVAAQVGERQEHLRREGQPTGVDVVTQRGRRLRELHHLGRPSAGVRERARVVDLGARLERGA